MSVRQQIRDAAIDLLNDFLPTGIPETTKRRFIPGEKLDGPRIAAFFLDEQDQRPGGRSGPITARGLVLALQAIVAVEDAAEADDAIEPLLEHIVERMGDTDLGGLATNVIEISTVWGGANDAGLFYLVALTRWRIEFQTARANLSAKQ